MKVGVPSKRKTHPFYRISNFEFRIKSLTRISKSPTKSKNLEESKFTDFSHAEELEILNSVKALKSKIFLWSKSLNKFFIVKINWSYGGNEVYIIGSFTNWDYMIKLNPVWEDGIMYHQISMVSYLDIHLYLILLSLLKFMFWLYFLVRETRCILLQLHCRWED